MAIQVTVQKIMDLFNKRIVGQEETKEKLASAIYAHYKFLEINEKMKWKDDFVKKHTGAILVYGPSGSGKTELFRCLRDGLGVPLKIIDTPTLSNAGYKGMTMQEVFEDYYYEPDRTKQEMKNYGIIVFDEFDKVCDYAKYSDGPNREYYKGFMNEILKLVEGKNFDGKDTGDLLIVFLGSFGRRLRELNAPKDKTMGFGASVDGPVDEVKTDLSNKDLLDFGLNPELLGRISLICQVDGLGTTMYKKILADESISPLKDYKLLFEDQYNELTFSASAINYIAEEAAKLGLGARGIRRVLDSYMLDVIYCTAGMQGRSINVTGRDMRNKKVPRIQKADYWR